MCPFNQKQVHQSVADKVYDFISQNQDTPTRQIKTWILNNTNASKDVADSATLMWAIGDKDWFEKNFK